MGPEVLVIGAGLAGLSAAAKLAGLGLEVLVVEESRDVGGRLPNLSCGGFVLDAGLYCFQQGEAGPIGELNQELGLGLHFLTSGDSYLLQGKRRLAVCGEGVETAEPEGAAFSREELERLESWSSRFFAADPGDWEKRSMAEFVQETGFGEDELVKSYAGALGLTLFGRRLEEVSAGMLMAKGKAGGTGLPVTVVAGGPGRIITRLFSLLSKDHVHVVLGSRVGEMEVRGGRVERVLTSSAEYAPAAVIYTGAVTRLPKLLSGEKVKGLSRGLRRQKAAAAITVEFGLETPVSKIAGVMIDPQEGVLGRFPSNLDSSLAPAGGQISSWLALIPEDDLEDVKSMGSHFHRLKKIAFSHFPPLAEKAAWERLRVVPVLAPAPLPGQTSDKRPGVRIKGVENLFLAGDGVAAPGFLSGSAVHSAGEAVERVKKLLSGGEGRSWSESS